MTFTYLSLVAEDTEGKCLLSNAERATICRTWGFGLDASDALMMAIERLLTRPPEAASNLLDWGLTRGAP